MTPDELMEHENHADAVAAAVARWGGGLARRAYACALRGREAAAWYGYDHTRSAFIDYGELSWLRVEWGARADRAVTVVRVGDDVAVLEGFAAFAQIITGSQPDVVVWRAQILLAFGKLLDAEVFDDRAAEGAGAAALFRDADGAPRRDLEPPHFEGRRFVFCARVQAWGDAWAAIVKVRIDADTYRVDAEELVRLDAPMPVDADDDGGDDGGDV